jgi:OmpA-OmpF porin, OOP family
LFDDETKDQIPGELIITIDGSDEVYKTISVDSLLGYDVLLEPGKKYNLKYKSDGYFNKRESIDLRNLTTYKEEKKDVYLTPFKEGQAFVIKNIFFELDKAKLKPESFVELDNLVDVLGEYPYIVVEIQGHTDNQGSDLYNEGLSQRRAQAVVDYIVSKGIPKHQFVATGYGEKLPRATNDTEEGRQINRRVEFKILKINKK